MTQLEFIEWFENYKRHTGIWIVEASLSIDTPYTIGCFKNTDNEYIVYINYEEGRLVVNNYKDEKQAYSILHDIVLVEIENSMKHQNTN